MTTDSTAAEALAGHRNPIAWAKAHGVTARRTGLAFAWACVGLGCVQAARKPSPRRAWQVAGQVCNAIALHFPRDGRGSLGHPA